MNTEIPFNIGLLSATGKSIENLYCVHTGNSARFWHGTALHGMQKRPCEPVPCRAEPYRAGPEETTVPHSTARHGTAWLALCERNRAVARCAERKRGVAYRRYSRNDRPSSASFARE